MKDGARHGCGWSMRGGQDGEQMASKGQEKSSAMQRQVGMGVER